MVNSIVLVGRVRETGEPHIAPLPEEDGVGTWVWIDVERPCGTKVDAFPILVTNDAQAKIVLESVKVGQTLGIQGRLEINRQPGGYTTLWVRATNIRLLGKRLNETSLSCGTVSASSSTPRRGAGSPANAP